MGASFSVLNNLAAINGINKLNANNVHLYNTLNRLASGKRINTGADDAAGLQIADGLRGHIMALNQSSRNAADGIAYLQIADGALDQVISMLQRMVTLAAQAANGTLTNSNRSALQKEFEALNEEIGRIADDTNFNGKAIFGGDGSIKVFIGDISRNHSTLEVKIASAEKVNGNLNSSTAAQNALSSLKVALNSVATARGDIGAGMNRLQAAINVISAQSQNTLSAESTIRDANMADEITAMIKYQIMAQAGIAALAQANANAQNILSLLR